MPRPNAMPTTNRPAAPSHLDGEARQEWDRVCDELAAAGRLDTADRAVVQLYAETWGVWRTACRHVAEFGPVVKQTNGVAGRSPYYTAMREQAALLRGLLSDMGLTPNSRGKGATQPDGDDLDI